MRKRVVAISIVVPLLIAVLILISRSSNSDTSVEGRWVGTYVAPAEYGGREVEVFLWFTDDSHYMFRDGCNTGGASYFLHGSEVTFDNSGGSSTAAGCSSLFPSLPDSVSVIWGSPSYIEIPSGAGPIRLVRVNE